jgi:hypothetical protein
MALITDYTTLKAEVASWLARADLTTAIPGFVQNAEAKLNRTLRALDQETKNATFSITGEYVAVPTNFLGARSFYLNTSPKQTLAFMPDDTQTDYFGAGSGRPKFYSVVGSNFRFGPVPDGTYSATLVYYTVLPPLASNATNWLILAHPDIYLYGSLMEAAGYLTDDPRIPMWRAAYGECVEQLKSQNNRARWGGNGMAVRPA